jgi:hypothetical protein
MHVQGLQNATYEFNIGTAKGIRNDTDRSFPEHSSDHKAFTGRGVVIPFSKLLSNVLRR